MHFIYIHDVGVACYARERTMLRFKKKTQLKAERYGGYVYAKGWTLVG